jgi:hypothetical protein
MRHNAERKRNGEDTTGEDDMRSGAADVASYGAPGADAVDPMAFVGTSVNMPAECFFQDDDMPPGCPPHGVGLIRWYTSPDDETTRRTTTCW